MRSDWQTKTLEELCDFRNGLWKGKKPPYIHVGIIRNTNFTAEGQLDDTNIAYHDVEEKQFAKRQLQFGDLILEKSGGGPKQPVGRVIPFEKTTGLFSFSNFTSIIRIQDPSTLDYKYLHRLLYWYYISGVTEGMQRRSTGIRNLDFKTYKQLAIPLPPLPEQERIVSILDEAFAAIAIATANAEKNLANARELFESHLASILHLIASSPPANTLADITELIVDCEHKTAPTQDSGYPSIRTPNIGKGHLILDNVKRVSKSTYDEWTMRAIPRSGDLILAREAPAGNVGVIPENELVCLGQRTVLIRPDESVNSHYLASLLLHPLLQEQLLSHSTGATVQHVNMRDIRALKIPELPPVEIQQEVIEQLKLVRVVCGDLVKTTVAKQNTLSELKQSILHKAFTGELTADPASIDRTLSEASV